jgi:hypothetical protein
MAKKKNKQKSPLPKRIAGVKVPKALRKGRAAEFLASPFGVAILSEALVVAGAAGVAQEAKPGSSMRKLAAKTREEMEEAAAAAKHRGQVSAAALRDAFSAASQAFSDRLHQAADTVEPEKKPIGRDPSLAAH